MIACYELASSSAADPSHCHIPNPHSCPCSHTSLSITAFVIASVWAYISLRVALSPSIHVHARPNILILLITLATAATVDGTGRVYKTYIYHRNWVPFCPMGWWLVDMALVCMLIWVIIITPLELLSK